MAWRLSGDTLIKTLCLHTPSYAILYHVMSCRFMSCDVIILFHPHYLVQFIPSDISRLYISLISDILSFLSSHHDTPGNNGHPPTSQCTRLREHKGPRIFYFWVQYGWPETWTSRRPQEWIPRPSAKEPQARWRPPPDTTRVAIFWTPKFPEQLTLWPDPSKDALTRKVVFKVSYMMMSRHVSASHHITSPLWE